MHKTEDIEILDEREGRVYCYVIELATARLLEVFVRNEQETTYSVCQRADVPDIVQLTFYRERQKLLDAINNH